MYKNREGAQVGAGDSEKTLRQMGEEFDLERGRHWRDNRERTPDQVGEQAMERNIQDNPKVIWGVEKISTSRDSYREHKKNCSFVGVILQI